jgi:hypothetical protein
MLTKARRAIATTAAASLAAVPALALAPSAQAGPSGTPLSDVLAADVKADGTPSFDRKKKDLDILTGAVQAVLAAKPNSPVGVLADPSVELTAFLPTDGAFKRVAVDLGIGKVREDRVLANLAGALGIDGVENVLLYHVLPGANIDAATALASDGATLTMASGDTVEVDVRGNKRIFLKDGARAYPKVINKRADVNKAPGNKQIAHIVNKVLLP